MSDALDPLGRVPLSVGMKQQIADAFRVVPEGKRGALLILADGQSARAHLAARIGSHWKVAGGLGFPWESPRNRSAWAAVEAVW